jgi:hypothetical protein
MTGIGRFRRRANRFSFAGTGLYDARGITRLLGAIAASEPEEAKGDGRRDLVC